MKKTLIGLAVGLVLFTACEPPKQGKINIGTVDTAVLVQDDPRYQEMSVLYVKENTALKEEFFTKLKAAAENKDKEKLDALRKDISARQKELDAKWLKKTQEFLASRHEAIKGQAEEIAKRKNIDMVIIDSSEYPTVEWGGVDMTPDMKLALSQSKPATEESGE